MLLLQVHFCLSTGFLDAEKKNVRYLGAHAICHAGTTILQSSMLRTSLMDALLDMLAVYGLLRPHSTHHSLGWRELKTVYGQPRALLWPDSRRR